MSEDDDRPGVAEGSPFDRIKTPEQRLLQRTEGYRLDDQDPDLQGRAALFTQGRRSSGPGLTVVCSRCEAASAVDAGTALRSLLPAFLVAPWRDHPVFAVCPSCRRRTWLRPKLSG